MMDPVLMDGYITLLNLATLELQTCSSLRAGMAKGTFHAHINNIRYMALGPTYPPPHSH